QGELRRHAGGRGGRRVLRFSRSSLRVRSPAGTAASDRAVSRSQRVAPVGAELRRRDRAHSGDGPVLDESDRGSTLLVLVLLLSAGLPSVPLRPPVLRFRRSKRNWPLRARFESF